MGPRGETSQLGLDLNPQSAKWHIQRRHDSSEDCQKTKEWVVVQFLEISTPSQK